MLRDLLKEGGLYTLGSVLTSGLSLLLIPVYTAYFSPSEFGILDIIAVYGGLFTAFVSLQLGQGLTRYVSDGTIDVAEKKIFASTAINFTIIFYLSFGAIVFFADTFFIRIISSDVKISEDLFDLAILTVLLNGIFYIQGLYFRSIRKIKQFTLLAFIHALSNILLTLLFVIGLDYGIIGVYYASIIVSPVLLFIQWALLRDKIEPVIKKKQLMLLLRFSIPLVPAGLSYWLLSYTDRIFINEYLDSAQLGIYSTGAKFSAVVTLIISGFSMAIGPILYEKHHIESSNAELARVAKLYFALGTFGVLMISIFSYETLVIFTNNQYYAAALIMPALYTAVLFSGIMMFAPGLNLNNRTITIAAVVVCSSILNIALNYFLIRKYGILGSAVSTLISVAFNNIVLFVISNRYFKIKLPYLRIALSMLLFVALMCFGCYIVPLIFPDFWHASLIKILAGSIYAFVLIRTGLFDLADIKKLKTVLLNGTKPKN